MAGSRKRGGNKANVKKLSLGDLVLAKVKGFPAWPAKISRPKDWEREPDPWIPGLVQIFLYADFFYYYFQSWKNNLKLQLPA